MRRQCIVLAVFLMGLMPILAQNPPREREPIYKGRLLSDWVKMLGDKDPAVRRSGATTLVEMGELAKSAAPALVEYLKSEVPYTRNVAVYALGQIQGDPKIVVPALLSALKDKDIEVRRSASHALLYQGPSLRESAAALGEIAHKDSDPDVRRLAVYVLGNIKQPKRRTVSEPPPPLRKEEVALLSDSMKDSDKSVREQVIQVLSGFTPEAESVVPILVAALEDADRDVRAAAASALEKFPAQAKTTVPSLLKSLRDKDAQVRQNAAHTLAILHKDTREHLSELKSLQKDAEPHTRMMAAYVIGNLKPPPPKPRDPSDIGKPLPPVEKRVEEAGMLVSALRDTDAGVRIAALEALKNYKNEGKEVIAGVTESLKDTDKNVRLKAMEVTTFFPDEAKQTVPSLIESLRDKDSDIRCKASVTLVALGFETKKHLAELRAILKEDAVHPRVLVVFVCGNLSDIDEKVLDVLYEALKDKEDSVRRRAEDVIKNREQLERKLNIEDPKPPGSDGKKLPGVPKG